MSTVAVHLDRLLEPIACCFSPEVAAKVADLRADDAMQSRIDYLADHANEGLIEDAHGLESNWRRRRTGRAMEFGKDVKARTYFGKTTTPC